MWDDGCPASCTCFTTCEASQVTFQYPVDIADLLRFRSSVVHTQQPTTPSTKVRCTSDSQSPVCLSVPYHLWSMYCRLHALVVCQNRCCVLMQGTVYVHVSATVTQPERVSSKVFRRFPCLALMVCIAIDMLVRLPSVACFSAAVMQVTNTFVFVFEVDMAAPEPATRAEAEQGEQPASHAPSQPRALKRVLPTSPEEAELICEILADD